MSRRRIAMATLYFGSSGIYFLSMNCSNAALLFFMLAIGPLFEECLFFWCRCNFNRGLRRSSASHDKTFEVSSCNNFEG